MGVGLKSISGEHRWLWDGGTISTSQEQNLQELCCGIRDTGQDLSLSRDFQET